jgi:hypothetical protein
MAAEIPANAKVVASSVAPRLAATSRVGAEVVAVEVLIDRHD